MRLQRIIETIAMNCRLVSSNVCSPAGRERRAIHHVARSTKGGPSHSNGENGMNPVAIASALPEPKQRGPVDSLE